MRELFVLASGKAHTHVSPARPSHAVTPAEKKCRADCRLSPGLVDRHSGSGRGPCSMMWVRVVASPSSDRLEWWTLWTFQRV